MYSLKQAAERAGISEGLLILWISVGKIKPSVNLNTTSEGLAGIAKQAFESIAPDGEMFGWNRFQFTDSDIERLEELVADTATKKATAKSSHVRGQNYTIQELASEWGLSDETVRKMFENEPGVLRIGKAVSRRNHRRYVSIRIPEEIAQRVMKRHSEI